MGQFGQGQAIRRKEDLRFITGTGRYTDDISFPGEVHGFVLRSPHAHARITAIGTEEALAMPGVLAIHTAADLQADGVGPLPVVVKVDGRDGSPMPVPYRPALAGDRVRYVGEPVAFVVAETLNQARDAAEAIAIEFEPLPAVVDMRAALEPGAPGLFDDVPGNTLFDWEMGEADAVAQAFSQAAHVVTLDLVNNRVAPTFMEARCCIGRFEGGRYEITTGSQGSHTLQRWLTGVFGVDKEHMHVIAPDVGGGFGARLFLYNEHVLVLHAAKRLGRAVRWAGDRSEAFLTDTHGRDHLSHAELALDSDGRFLALRVETLANIGAFVSQMGAFIPTTAGTAMLTGVYAIPHAHARVRGVMTNTCPTDAYRGAGRPEALYLIERLVDKAARQLGFAPDALRRRNFIPPDAMPFKTALGRTYDSGEFARNQDEAMQIADWLGFPARREAALANGKLRGIGLAYYVERCGGGADETASITVTGDGKARVLIGTQSTGQGHETAYAQIAASALGIPIEDVTVIQGDTDIVPTGRGTGGSRSLPVGGVSLAQASEAIIAAGLPIAERLLQAAGETVEFEAGRYRVAGTERHVSLAEICREAGGLTETRAFEPGEGTYPNGCHICELEIDAESGAVRMIRHVIVDDIGVVLNPLLLEGQIIGGAVQGIGQALCEHAVYDPGSGQLITGTFMDYSMPRADLIPEFVFKTNEIPCRTNPLGIKGAGEAGTIGAAPAVMNAILDALAPLGVTDIDMPATQEKLWRLIRAKAA